MSTQQKRLHQRRKREVARRQERRRRFEADRCNQLMIEAEIASDLGNLDSCAELLEKVLRIRPNSAEALEWAAQICFNRERWKEGLGYYERLREMPRWPPLMFFAALAAWNLNQAGRSEQLLAEFLSVPSRKKEFSPAWKAATSLSNAVRRSQLFSKVRQDIVDSEWRIGPAPEPGREMPVSTGIPKTQTTPGLSLTETTGPSPKSELPDFPKVAVPEIEVRLDFAVLSIEHPSIAPSAEIFLRRDYAILTLQKGFDELLAPGASNLEHFWYQLETVRRVLRDFRGRALLADEVGLGKTIEAGLALKEYTMRGLIKKTLILTPPSLVAQWLEELRTKFNLAPVSPETGGYGRDPEKFWSGHDLVVASLPLARQPANRELLLRIDYDLIIVDEAHYLKNRSTSAWQLVNELKKRFLLLLSATPVGNNLAELYNLILLLRPGLLGTEAQFRREYGATRAGGLSLLEDRARRDRLRCLLSEVMVRNTRAHIDLKLPRRVAATEKVTAGDLEAEILEELSAFIRARYHSAGPSERLRLMMLQMQAGSSASALRYGLRDAASNDEDPLHAITGKLAGLDRSAKTGAVLALTRRSREKKIVFTRFLATLEELRLAFESDGVRVSIFHGGMTSAEKDAAIQDFRDRSEILLSSEAGGEGRNLQFCNTVINFDLPWNPVTIEQRVGRIHRIGQTREVFVFNFCLVGSIEEHILKVLHEKINLFELVAGEIEMIVGELGQEQDFSTIVMDLWARGDTSGEREHAFERFAEELHSAKSRYQKIGELEQALFGEDYEA